MAGLALTALLGGCEPTPGGDAPTTASAVVANRATAVSASAAPSPLSVREGPSKELEGRALQYPTDGVLALAEQDVSILPATLDATVRAAFCAELTTANTSLRCAKEAKEEGPVISVNETGASLALRGQLLVRTGIGQDLAHGLEITYDGSGDRSAVAREVARRWVKTYLEGLARRTHAPPKAVVAVSRGEPRGISDRARVVLGDGVYEITTANEKIPEANTFPVLGVTALTPGQPVQRTQLIDESPSMPAALFALRDAVVWDPSGHRVLLARGRSGPAADKTVPGGACKDEDDCPGLTLLATDAAARATVVASLTDLTVQSGPAVVGDDVYVLGAQGKQMFVVRFHAGAAPERTKIDLPVNPRAAMPLVPLGSDALGAVRTGPSYEKQAIYRFSVKKGKVGAVKTIALPGASPNLTLDGRGGLVVVSSGGASTCKVVALDETGATRFHIEVPEVASGCPTPEVAGEVVSLPKIGWFSSKDGKPAGAKGFEGTSLTRVGDLLVACTATGIGAWNLDGTVKASVDVPGGCERIGASSKNGVLVAATSAGAYELSPPTAW
ncbi:MAG: hypothetical protein U0414_24215 [Polyangiaceae bacterium]